MNNAAPQDPTPRQTGSNPALVAILREEIDRAGGQITVARFMNLALYHPDHGYYLAPDRRPGRGGDFLTSPEASPYFGITLARQIAECWERLDRPRPFTVREYGAGIGGLAYDVIAGLHDTAPALLDGLSYRLVEPNRHRVAQALAAMGEVGFGAIVSAEEPPAPGTDLPPITGVVLANEVADAFPVHRLIAREDGFREQYVIWSAEGDAPAWFGFSEGEPSSPEVVARWEALRAGGVTPGRGRCAGSQPGGGLLVRRGRTRAGPGLRHRDRLWLPRHRALLRPPAWGAAPRLRRTHRHRRPVRAHRQPGPDRPRRFHRPRSSRGNRPASSRPA